MSSIEGFAREVGKEWEEIFMAVKTTKANKEKIVKELEKIGAPPTSSDIDLVVFGSIARDECTSGSDVDWTLLIDGLADSNHLNIARIVEKAIINTELAERGKSGMFGQITFSHDLIHKIGGQEDTNHNLSKRLLLLLESNFIKFKENDGSAWQRIINGIIAKYIDNDSGYSAKSEKENVPRFLLNDFIRLWRTMCVDFAYKQIEQEEEKWALRNIKLRMSRKLIFTKGLLMCAKLYKTDYDKEEIKNQLRTFVEQKPLEFMVSTFLEYKIAPKYIEQILDCYNMYLKMLNNNEMREQIKRMNMKAAYDETMFLDARENSHEFQRALNNIFLLDTNKIGEFTLKYGVF